MIALLLALLPHQELSSQPVDVIEINHPIDIATGKENFSQFLFRNYDGRDFPITDWRLCKGQQLTKHGDYWRLTWMDGGRMNSVRAESVIETWSDYDPELAEREKLPKEKRKLLR